MAVYAAHLTRTLQGTPSVFQITAQEALGSTVKPALRKLVEYLAACYPGKFAWCERWYDELYLVFDGVLQYHYLKHYAASFSECFYGLVRVPIVQSNEFSSGPRLPASLERGSLALLVLLPYLKDKAERLVERWREDHEDGRLGKSTVDRCRKAAIRIYSIVHFVCESWRLVCLARYLVGRSPAATPELALLGLTLKDAPPPEPEEDSWSDFARALLTGRFRSASITFPMVWGALAGGAQYAAFGVQLLRWWAAAAPRHTTDMPTPSPPLRDERFSKFVNKCPLCLQVWKVPTVLPVSGLVFCYSCISRHVRAHAACPTTKLPAAEATLVRLYIDT